MKNLKTGIQMYTIREALKQDFKGVCRELVKLGCDGAEFVSFGDMEPKELAAFLKEIGLNACGIHLSAKHFETDETDPSVFAYAKALETRYVTFSFGGDFTQVTPDVVRLCRNAGEAAGKNGLIFTYHNHAAEFAVYSGLHALDFIYANTDPARVMAELDVYWVAKGGEDPVKYIRTYAQRTPQIHLKDMDRSDGSFTELGQGCIDLESCVRAAREGICEWLIYEQDICRRSPFESAVMSLEYLNRILNR